MGPAGLHGVEFAKRTTQLVRRLRKRGGRVMRVSTVCETRARRAHTPGRPDRTFRGFVGKVFFFRINYDH